MTYGTGLLRAQWQWVSGVQWDLFMLVVTLSYHQQSEPGELGCRNTLQLLPCKGRQLLQEPVVVFKQYRCIMYIVLLLSLGALWKRLAFLCLC